MFFIFDIIDYLLHPKYVVMRGIKIENRMIMFIGSHPVFSETLSGDKILRFSNNNAVFYKKNIYKRIWTYRELIKWRRLIGKTTMCLRANLFSIERV